MKLKKLNARGFSHDIILVLFVAIFAIAGVAYLVASHADSTSPATTATSVSATPTWHGQNPNGGGYGQGTIAAIAIPSTSQENVFSLSNSGTLHFWPEDQLNDLGVPQTLSTPGALNTDVGNLAAIATASKTVAVFAVDAQGNTVELSHKFGTSWPTTWQNLGTLPSKSYGNNNAPYYLAAVSPPGTNTIQLVAANGQQTSGACIGDSFLWRNVYNGSSWSGWKSWLPGLPTASGPNGVGPIIPGTVAISASSSSRFDVFTTDCNGTPGIWHTNVNGQKIMLGWTQVPGAPPYNHNPAAVSWGPNQVELQTIAGTTGTGGNNIYDTRSLNNGSTWTGWSTIGNPALVSTRGPGYNTNISLDSRGVSRLDAFYTDNSGVLWNNNYY